MGAPFRSFVRFTTHDPTDGRKSSVEKGLGFIFVLTFMNSCMRSLSEDVPIKQTWLGTVNVWREFVVSSSHVCDQSVCKNIREDMEDRWVTNLSEDRKRFYLVSSLLDTHTQMLSFCAHGRRMTKH